LLALNNIASLRLRREHVVLVFMVLLSASYAYVTMANSEFYIDEKTYARVGYSLVQGHLASDSSLLPIYEKFGLVRSDIHTPFGYIDSVEPWLDHPPLVPLTMVPLLLVGASPRLLPIIFSTITAPLIFVLLRDRRVLAWASTMAWTSLFITHPILSMLFLDSGVAFFNLLAVTMMSEYSRSRSAVYLYLAGFLAGASALSKIYGTATLLFFLVFLLNARRGSSKDSLAKSLRPFLLAVGIASIWPIYGFATNASLFIQLLQSDFSRSVLSGNIVGFPALASMSYTGTTMYSSGLDLSLLIGWMALIYSLSKKKLQLIQTSALFYLLIVIALRYAWYYTMIPLFPFFAIGIGTVISDVTSVIRRHFPPSLKPPDSSGIIGSK
jgi:hypothetical protein